MTIRLLFIFRRRWPILIVLPLLAGAMGYLFTPRGDALKVVGYSSAAIVAVDQGATTPTDVQQTLLEAEQGAIAEATAKAMGAGVTTADVTKHLTATFDDETYVVNLQASGRTPEQAKKYADAISATFIKMGNEAPAAAQRQLLVAATQNRDAAKNALDVFLAENDPVLSLPDVPASVMAEREQLESTLQQAESDLATTRSSQTSGEVYRLINVEDGALTPASKLQLPASLALRVTLGVLFGLVGAAVLIAIIEKLNPRIDMPEQASQIIEAPVLAMVPVMNRRHRKALVRADPERFSGPFAESFRAMRTHLDFRSAAEDRSMPPRIMVTSASPAEGKSTSTAFLALAYAEVERHPIVVGADLRRPSIHKLFDVGRTPGLSSRITAGEERSVLNEIVHQDLVSGVSVIPSGPSIDRVTGLLGDLGAVTTAGQSAGRVVLVDTAPVMVANDAVDFLVAVDWVIVVVRVGRSTERSVRQMMQTLRLNSATIAGVVMVGSLESSDAKRYYYSYYSPETAKSRERAKQANGSDATSTLPDPG